MAGLHPGAAGAPAAADPVPCSTFGAELRLFLGHLRLPFQLVLAPIFMLGALLGGGSPSLELGLAFLAVHAGIYGGMTAFNSVYDRDRGPIGFMKHPRPAGRFVRDAAIAVQLASVLILAAMRLEAMVPALILVAMGIAYSHPRWRWKSQLGASLFAVGVGQGMVACALGFLAAGGPVARLFTPRILTAAVASSVVTLGLYPVTQLYQLDEDRARGDRTLPVALGWRRALIVSALLVAAGVAILLGALEGQIAPVWFRLLPAGVLILWMLFYLWSRRFESLDPYRNHDWAMGLGLLASSVFWILIASEWVRTAGELAHAR